MIPLLTAACTTPPTPPPERPSVPTPIPLPDTTGIDFEASFRSAIDLLLTVDARALFASQRMAMERFQPGCPDLYLGLPPPDLGTVDRLRPEDASGVSWADHCSQDGGNELFFSGFSYWDAHVDVTGDASTPEGRQIEADRLLMADGVLGDASGVLFGFDGSASDAFSATEAPHYDQWRYASLVDGTATGRHPFPADSPTPDGWRTDLYVERTGGEVESLVLRGNLYVFEGHIDGRFDSIAADLSFTGERGASPDACNAEPRGWIGLRDPDATWYELVFLPRSGADITEDPYPNDPLQSCDGCGTLYVRGVEQGTVCPDFSGLFDAPPPDLEPFVFSIRELPIGEQP